MLILDSTFLVDLEREHHRREAGGATHFLKVNGDSPLAVTFTIAGELAAGRSLGGNRAAWLRFLAPFHNIGYTEEVGWRFGVVYRDLKARGRLIGANDLWIAATALAHDLPIVTRNHDEFRQVSGLSVFAY